MFRPAALTATLVALASSAAAQLSIISPGGPGLWWVDQSLNTLSWTCETSPFTNFTVQLANSDPTVLASPLAIISQEMNFNCAQTISATMFSLPPAQGYTVLLADPFNGTNVYATSQPFEIKAFGSAYPASSATPTVSGTGTNSPAPPPSGTASGSGSSASVTGSAQKSNGAVGLTTSLGGLVGAAVGLLFV
ncbi:hypothetical protein CERSUDRAFT_86235 [Gelatoporia subvermispora B]|uniref:Uncharacterized protein n=1 Tax=Ceriporiopsis subvermispora (strain B) TaxID=914234 RepID=M2R8R4_CERS8|nr:hypothetical protein CERSUDRAFT_86235 [Gelatoporia subvermispora B]